MEHVGTLADFLNSPREIEFEGTKWKLRQPTLDEEGEFQVWLEQEEYNAIERRTYQSEEQKIQDRKELNESAAVGDYEYGGPLVVKSLSRPKGIAKIISIICRDQGMDDGTAKRMAKYKLSEIAVTICSKLEGMDPKTLGELCLRHGLPADYFFRGSATHPSTDPLENLAG
jgi:hypothetical protein